MTLPALRPFWQHEPEAPLFHCHMLAGVGSQHPPSAVCRLLELEDKARRDQQPVAASESSEEEISSMSEDASSQLGSPRVPNGVHKANGPARAGGSGRKDRDNDSVSQASTSSAESLVSVAAERFPTMDELTVLVRPLGSLC